MLFFRSEEHVTRWLRARDGERGAVLTLDAVWHLARAWYEDRRCPGWSPRSPEEAQAVLDALKLPPDREFWQMRVANEG